MQLSAVWNNYAFEHVTPKGDGQNTDPQSMFMDYPNGLAKWATLKLT